MNIDVNAVRRCLKSFDFPTLFREHLGWDKYQGQLEIPIDGKTVELSAVAQKRGFVAYVCDSIPDRPTRLKIDQQVTKSAREHFVIYTDRSAGQQVWQWVRREPGKPLASRDHRFDASQTGEALIQRLSQIAISIDEEESLSLVDVASKTRKAFDLDKVTKKFYDRFKSEHAAYQKFIKGIRSEADLQWYTSIMLNRLMFVYFIQKKGFLDGDADYLRNRMQRVREAKGKDKFHTFYRYFLVRLFHEGLGKSPDERKLDRELEKLIGKVPYLNGGFFEVHELEARNPEIDIPDKAFEKLFDFFDEFRWHLDERPLRADNEINPDVVGYIFEKYINQKQMGAYYTKEDITEYISKNTIIPFLFDAAEKKCPIAFRPESFLWRLLKDNPDRYIYAAVRHGVIDDQSQVIPLPKEIEAGVKNVAKREGWNKPATEPYALPTETWREHVARRQRCLENRQKLQDGPIHAINDLITLNLDIWQFARDAIVNSEGPELLRAFWQAIQKVTVLDPTCGSGAFLFAALRILETLYSDCLQAMLSFVEEPPAAPAAPEEQLRDLIARGENDRREFKSTMRHCVKTAQANIPEAQKKEVLKAKDKDRNHDVLKSVAAMLNTSGGDVIVGVDDHGTPLGLANDYAFFKEADRNADGYELWLRQLFVNHFGVLNSQKVRALFVTLDGQDVLWLRIAPAETASYVTGENKQKFLYIRNGNETRALEVEQIVAHHQTRFTPEAIKALPAPAPEPVVKSTKKKRFEDFRVVLDQIRKHPNERYFILKCIIINNLYGVDIMEEAVEICKLRLFLKLVAQVDSVDQIEPLPDIDFNIRAGNTLVGYTSLDEVRKARETEQSGGTKQKLWLDSEAELEIRRIEEDALAVEKCFQQFRAQQMMHGGKVTAEDKQELRHRLQKLDSQLDHFLATEYGLVSETFKAKGAYEEAFANWKCSHEPFHWFVEFFGIMQDGGFDVIIGNPPWKEYASVKNQYTVRGYATEACGNLHCLCTERCIQVRQRIGRLSLIVQLPLVSSSRMATIRRLLSDASAPLHIIPFDDRPGKLFEGLQHCRSVIVLSAGKGTAKCELFTCRYQRWHTEARATLFAQIEFANTSGAILFPGLFPKYATDEEASVFRRVATQSQTTIGAVASTRETKSFVFYQEATGYWVKAIVGLPRYAKNGVQGAPAHGRYVYCKDAATANRICAILNSSLFYAYFIAYGDCFHLSDTLVEAFPIQPAMAEDAELARLGVELTRSLKANAVDKTINTKDGSKITYAEFFAAESKQILDEIDQRLSVFYGFSTDETEFIINYDTKYRMGQDDGSDDE